MQANTARYAARTARFYTRGMMRGLFAAFVLLVGILAPNCARADGTLTAEYFVLSDKHPDVGHGLDYRIVQGLV